jgi:uncharacterized repeat protein (TIGR01451 family)
MEEHRGAARAPYAIARVALEAYIPDMSSIGARAMRRGLLMTCCFALLEGMAFAQSPDVGIAHYVVDLIDHNSDFTSGFEAGQQMLLNICYANTGTGDASGMSYTVALPAGLSGVSVKSTQALSTSGTYNSGTGVLTITGLPDPLVAGAELCGPGYLLFAFSRVMVSFTAPSSNFDAVAIVATSTPQSPNVLPDSITGHFLLLSRPPTLTDLSVLIEGPVAVGPGVPVEYTAGVQNLGPRDAHNVVLSVQLPLGISGVAVTGGSFDAASGRVSWPIVDTITAGGQQAFGFSITNPPPAQGLASVLSDNSETNYFNNVLLFNLQPAATAIPGPGPRLVGMLATALLVLGCVAVRKRQPKRVAR